MKISEKLPQFEKERTLLIVSGNEGAILYVAHKGEIEEASSFRVEPVRYSDKEGMTMRSGHGKVFARGSSLQEPKEKIRKEFFLELEARLSAMLDKGIESCVLLAPRHTAPDIASHLPQFFKERLTKTLEGNFVSHHPFNILEKLK